MIHEAKDIYKHFKRGRHSHYDEKKHCELLINIMSDHKRGTHSAFCVEAMVPESTFYYWLNKFELFRDIYYFMRMVARNNWEKEGQRIKDIEIPIGMTNNEFEYWKIIGWSRFGISKNSRIKLNLDPNDTPNKHYAQVLKQASEGDFTASEIKQLMEAVNVGLNTHQVFELQKQIDELKSDLSIMRTNASVENNYQPDKRTA